VILKHWGLNGHKNSDISLFNVIRFGNRKVKKLIHYFRYVP